MKRFYIFEGDKTSSGGIPIASQDHSTWHGRYYIMLNDKVYCPACKKTGTIIGQGPRLDDNWMGKRPALNDDICVCDCRPAPKLIAYQDNDWQMMTAEEVAYQGGGAAQNVAATAPISQFFGSTLGDDETHAIRFQALDPETGDPMPKCAYTLMRENGAQHGGVTDREGFTEVIETARPEQIGVHFMFKSPKGETIDREDLTA
ncbi:PAAR domain-containing protein [Herbaspirillum lusitanum]|uniref:PAAR domain-containing protein n=1 Tax=Herbaspirillum lusitanum TaxID=213312 RepID=UPI0003615F1D|nr:PAAR domain-containing protein [Herbaspirillum lusitanum]